MTTRRVFTWDNRPLGMVQCLKRCQEISTREKLETTTLWGNGVQQGWPMSALLKGDGSKVVDDLVLTILSLKYVIDKS